MYPLLRNRCFLWAMTVDILIPKRSAIWRVSWPLTINVSTWFSLLVRTAGCSLTPSWGWGPERNLPSIISKSGSLQVRESTVVYWSSNKEHIIFIDFGQKMRRFLDGSLLFICTADGRSEQKQIQCLLSLPEGVKPRCCACSLNCG